MKNQLITYKRLCGLRWLDSEILRCNDLLKQENEKDLSGLFPQEDENDLLSETIHDVIQTSENTRIRILNRLEWALNEKDFLIAWIDSIPRDDIRAFIFLHYMKGLKWKEVAAQYYGDSRTTDSIKHICYRYIHDANSSKEL